MNNLIEEMTLALQRTNLSVNYATSSYQREIKVGKLVLEIGDLFLVFVEKAQSACFIP